jgi:hypothetical protein
LIVIGMGALGVLVGLFAAWSATPIVTTLLPLLFGIVGGVSGVSIAKMDVSSNKSQLKIRLLGQMLAAFSIACTIAVLLAVYFRPQIQDADQATLVYGKTSIDYVDALVLRRKLAALGASPKEVGYLLELLNAETKPDISAIDRKIDELLGRKYSAAASTSSAPSPQPSANMSADQKDIEQLKRLAEPDQWPDPGRTFPNTVPDPKSKFPLAFQPPRSSFGYTFDGDKLLYGYGGGAADSLIIRPDSPLMEQFYKKGGNG